MTKEKLFIEERLIQLCEETLKILQSLKQEEKITENQFEQHAQLKLAFIQNYPKKDF